MAPCSSCGASGSTGARYCPSCGAVLDRSGETRRTVTVVFCDLVDSTPLGERLDVEAWRRIQSAFFDEMRLVLEQHGGTVEKYAGDDVMAVFGVPLAHEDDALRAVRAAVELRSSLARLNERLAEQGVRLAARTGVNTGEVVAASPADGQGFVSGDAVAAAKRLEQTAAAGEILIGEMTQRLVRNAAIVEPVPPFAVKGKMQSLVAYRLVAVIPHAPAFGRRLDSPLVGREREQRLLQEIYERALADRSCHLFTLLGVAGVGKSRLAGEFADALAGAQVVKGRCLPYGDGITYWPVVEVVKQLHRDERDLDPPVGAALMGLLGTGGRVSKDEIAYAVRRLFEVAAREWWET